MTFRKSLLPSSSVPIIREKCHLNQIHLNAVLTVIFQVLIILKKKKGLLYFTFKIFDCFYQLIKDIPQAKHLSIVVSVLLF